MGKSVIITSIVIINGNLNQATEWRSKDHGRATDANLKRYLQGYRNSFKPGGVNDHCSTVPEISNAAIKNQKTNKITALYLSEQDGGLE